MASTARFPTIHPKPDAPHRSRDASPGPPPCPRGLRARLPLRPVGTLAQAAALRTTQSTRTGSQKGKGPHADAVEASEGQRKHPKGAA